MKFKCVICGKEFVKLNNRGDLVKHPELFDNRRTCGNIECKRKHKLNTLNSITRKKSQWVLNYKSKRACIMCGYNEHTEVLEFHHKNRKYKKFNISNGSTIDKIKKEISKCILICPNCHRWFHHKGRK